MNCVVATLALGAQSHDLDTSAMSPARRAMRSFRGRDACYHWSVVASCFVAVDPARPASCAMLSNKAGSIRIAFDHGDAKDHAGVFAGMVSRLEGGRDIDSCDMVRGACRALRGQVSFVVIDASSAPPRWWAVRGSVGMSPMSCECGVDRKSVVVSTVPVCDGSASEIPPGAYVSHQHPFTSMQWYAPNLLATPRPGATVASLLAGAVSRCVARGGTGGVGVVYSGNAASRMLLAAVVAVCRGNPTARPVSVIPLVPTSSACAGDLGLAHLSALSDLVVIPCHLKVDEAALALEDAGQGVLAHRRSSTAVAQMLRCWFACRCARVSGIGTLLLPHCDARVFDIVEGDDADEGVRPSDAACLAARFGVEVACPLLDLELREIILARGALTQQDAATVIGSLCPLTLPSWAPQWHAWDAELHASADAPAASATSKKAKGKEKDGEKIEGKEAAKFRQNGNDPP